MTEKTNLNISPYYDDYEDDKNYHKIIYRAGRPIQARELTQTQTILQTQIERLGGHFFKEGSLVQGAQTDIRTEMFYVKVKPANPNGSGEDNVATYLTDFHGKFLRGQTSGVIFKVFRTEAETSDDPPTLFGYFIQQGTDSFNSFTFYSNEILEEVTLNSDGAPTVVAGNNNQFELTDYVEGNITVGRTSTCSITEGLVYTRGYFVKVPQQTIILDKYSSQPTYKVGLQIVEERVSSANDVSLNDNSQGTSNENAAGADRLKLSLVLQKQLVNVDEDLNFIELGRVIKGTVQAIVQDTAYGPFEKTMARRTHDANGDFMVRPFIPSTREHLDTGTNGGLYVKRKGGLEENFSLEVSAGKAYVRGYEITKTGTVQITMPKARTTVPLSGASTSARIGNNIKITNMNSLPDFGSDLASTNPFGHISFYDETVTTPGTEPGGNKIGFARVRDITLFDGTDTSGIYDLTSKFNLSCFDVKMFTKLTGTTSVATFEAGDKVIGSTSGSTGIVAESVTSGGSAIFIHDVVGTFQVGEAVNARGNTATMATTTAIRSYNIDRVRSTFSSTASGGTDFTADIVLDLDFALTGTATVTNGSPNVTGFLSSFAQELKEGDVIVGGDGSEGIVQTITSDNAIVLTTNFSGTTFTGNIIRRRAKIEKQNQTASIFAWPRDWVATSTVGSNTVRKQKVVTISGGQFVIESGFANSELGSVSDPSAFTVAVLTQQTGDLSAGDVIDLTDPTWTKSVTTGTGGVGEKLTVSGFVSGDNNVQLLISYTVDFTDQTRRSKTIHKSRCLSVESPSSAGVFYGTAYDHKDISLGVADVFKIRGIFEGVGGSEPLPPSAAFDQETAPFITGEEIVGQSSGARAIIIKYDAINRTYFYYTSSLRFGEGEYVVGQDSRAVAELDGLSQGSLDITDRYFFDNGQRDGYYDLAKITLKPGAPSPNNKLLIIFDYFTGSGGDFYDVGSYTGIPYAEIPVYSPNKVDLGGLEPDGTFELSDAVDCRPSVGQVLGTTSFSVSSPDPESPVNISDNSGVGARYAPFSYVDGRSFLSSRPNIATTGSSLVATAVDGTAFNSDIEFYVPRIDRVFLSKNGRFEVARGIPSITPTRPKNVDDSIELFEVFIPPYTAKLKNVNIKTKEYRRFTMADIAKINKRLSNLERVTTLSLLESDAQNKQILDADGFNRFKSGFVVDNFRGHRVGDVLHPDYQVAIDKKKGRMRPKSTNLFVDTFVDRRVSKSMAYHRNNIVTLPYMEASYVNQDKASRSVNVNPYSVFSFTGVMVISPSQDLWYEESNVEIRSNREGAYNTVIVDQEGAEALGAREGEALGTVWNSWQTSWSGDPEVVDEEVTAYAPGHWEGDPNQGGTWVSGNEIVREITETPETQVRNGIKTTVVEDIVETSNTRTVSIEFIAKMRSRTLVVECANLKPNTNHFPFFDNIDVSKYTRPYNSEFSQDSNFNTSSGLKTNGSGRLIFEFQIPNTPQQSFATGQRTLNVTSSAFNQANSSSYAEAEYKANGSLRNTETEFVSTRNTVFIQENVTQQKDIMTRGENLNFNPYQTTAVWPDVPVDTVSEDDLAALADQLRQEIGDIQIPPAEVTINNPPATIIQEITQIIEVVDSQPPEVVDMPVKEIYEDDPVVIDDPPPPVIFVPGPPIHDWGCVIAPPPGDAGDPPTTTSPPPAPPSQSDGYLDNNFEGIGDPIDTTPDDLFYADEDLWRDPIFSDGSVNYEGSGDLSAAQQAIYPENIVPEDQELFMGDERLTAGFPFGLSTFQDPAAEISDTNKIYQPQVENIVSDASAFQIGSGTMGSGIGVFPNLSLNLNNMGCWIDPLAQSFMVSKVGGMHVTSVDLFFATKDTTMPVTVQIRNMVNGYPGPVIMPEATTVMYPKQINVSDDASLATTFKFPSPIILEDQKEYCVVVLSNSDSYECWVSRMGEIDVNTGLQISAQPYAGSLFKSQNASTWTAEQTDDLKMNLKIAQYRTDRIGQLAFRNINIKARKLKNNPIESFTGQNYLKVYSTSHGMYDTTSRTTLSHIVGDQISSIVGIQNSSLVGSPTDGTYSDQPITYASGSGGTGATADITISSGALTDIRIRQVGSGYTEGDLLQVQNFDSGADVTFSVETTEDTFSGFPLSTINTTFNAIANIDMDSYTIIPDTSAFQGNEKLVGSFTALSSSRGGGNKVRNTKNIYFDAMQTMIPNIQPQGTNIYSQIYPTQMNSPEGVGSGTPYSKKSTSTYFTLNDNVFFDTPNVVASRDNEQANMQSTKSLDIRVNFYSQNPNISPQIDCEATGMVGIMNRINNIDSAADVPTGTTYIPSTEPEGDNNAMVYITKRVSLKAPASSLKIYSDNFRPNGCELKFMYKIVKNDEDTPIDDLGWEYFNGTGGPDAEIDTDSRNFKEYEYTADNLPEFGSFQIKIVGQSSNTSVIPTVSALRIMALA